MAIDRFKSRNLIENFQSIDIWQNHSYVHQGYLIFHHIHPIVASSST